MCNFCDTFYSDIEVRLCVWDKYIFDPRVEYFDYVNSIIDIYLYIHKHINLLCNNDVKLEFAEAIYTMANDLAHRKHPEKSRENIYELTFLLESLKININSFCYSCIICSSVCFSWEICKCMA